MEWIGQEDDFSHVELPNDKPPHLNQVNFYLDAFAAAMNGDLNTPAALAVVFEMITWYRKTGMVGSETHDAIQKFIEQIKETFGCFEAEEAEAVPEAVQALVALREQSRASKDFAASDRLRGEIRTHGYEVRDTDEGQKLSKM